MSKLTTKKVRATVAGTVRKMVLAGKSNKQIWSVLKLNYKLDDTKKHYPAWYRAQMRRQGLLSN